MFASSAASIGSYRQIDVSASADEGHACPVIANARHQVQHPNTVRRERIQGGWVRQGSSHIVGLVLHTLANTGRPLQALTSPQKLCLQQEIRHAVQGNYRPVYKWPINGHAGCVAIGSLQQQTYKPMCCQDGTSHARGCTRRWRIRGGGEGGRGRSTAREGVEERLYSHCHSIDQGFTIYCTAHQGKLLQ